MKNALKLLNTIFSFQFLNYFDFFLKERLLLIDDINVTDEHDVHESVH